MKVVSRIGFLLALISLTTAHLIKAQECTGKLIIKLKNTRGGVYAGQKITLTDRADGKVYSETSNSSGEANFVLPCNSLFDAVISNYTRKKELHSPQGEGVTVTQSFSYEPDMAKKDALFAMNETEKKEVDAQADALPDTTVMKSSAMERPSHPECFVREEIQLEDINGKALSDEHICITGTKRNKSVKGITDRNGHLIVFLPKGDHYSIHFKYNRDFTSLDAEYSKGTATAGLHFSYLGTKEIERRKKEEAERIAREEKRLKEDMEKFAKECKKAGISLEEGYRRKMMSDNFGNDTAALAALNRNKWVEKLIVCDLTGSMMPYASQLSLWYKLNYRKEKNLQFVFFNDGDNKPDNQKKIGSTGGIYYSASKGLDSLARFIAFVSGNGSGGDCPENNMEALIKGVEMALPYKELVMIVDNNAPVKDISLLKKFDRPVHIILCGASDGYILTDYLNIAWKTKGSVHTIEEDITKIAAMLEGQEITIRGNQYKIMGGEFVLLRKT